MSTTPVGRSDTLLPDDPSDRSTHFDRVIYYSFDGGEGYGAKILDGVSGFGDTIEDARRSLANRMRELAGRIDALDKL